MGISASPLYYSLVGAVFKLSGFAFVHSPVPSTVRVWLPSPHLSRQTLLYLILLSTFGCCGYDCLLCAFLCFLCIGLFSTCRDRLSRQCSFYSLCFLCILVWCVLYFVYISLTYVVVYFDLCFILYPSLHLSRQAVSLVQALAFSQPLGAAGHHLAASTSQQKHCQSKFFPTKHVQNPMLSNTRSNSMQKDYLLISLGLEDTYGFLNLMFPFFCFCCFNVNSFFSFWKLENGHTRLYIIHSLVLTNHRSTAHQWCPPLCSLLNLG